MVVIADGSKEVATLGRFPLPVEIVPFGLETTRRRIAALLREMALAGEPTLRRRPDGSPFTTDGGHLILDMALGAIPDAPALALALSGLVGVVEHGLFIGLASAALIGTESGTRIIGRI